jgi:hypothetical protein
VNNAASSLPTADKSDSWASGDSIHDLIDWLEAGYDMPLGDGQFQPMLSTEKETQAAKALRELLEFRDSIMTALDYPNLSGDVLSRIKWLQEHGAAAPAILQRAINVVNEFALAGHISDKGISCEAIDAIRAIGQ